MLYSDDTIRVDKDYSCMRAYNLIKLTEETLDKCRFNNRTTVGGMNMKFICGETYNNQTKHISENYQNCGIYIHWRRLEKRVVIPITILVYGVIGWVASRDNLSIIFDFFHIEQNNIGVAELSGNSADSRKMMLPFGNLFLINKTQKKPNRERRQSKRLEINPSANTENHACSFCYWWIGISRTGWQKRLYRRKQQA